MLSPWLSPSSSCINIYVALSRSWAPWDQGRLWPWANFKGGLRRMRRRRAQVKQGAANLPWRRACLGDGAGVAWMCMRIAGPLRLIVHSGRRGIRPTHRHELSGRSRIQSSNRRPGPRTATRSCGPGRRSDSPPQSLQCSGDVAAKAPCEGPWVCHAHREARRLLSSPPRMLSPALFLAMFPAIATFSNRAHSRVCEGRLGAPRVLVSPRS